LWRTTDVSFDLQRKGYASLRSLQSSRSRKFDENPHKADESAQSGWISLKVESAPHAARGGRTAEIRLDPKYLFGRSQ
jgi:hypothetical protein